MAKRTAPQGRDDRLIRAIDELFRSLDDERERTEEREREDAKAGAEALERRFALVFHDLGVAELTDGWATAQDGRLTFTDLERRRAERLVLAFEQLARKYERFR
jgi:hypothetical protein